MINNTSQICVVVKIFLNHPILSFMWFLCKIINFFLSNYYFAKNNNNGVTMGIWFLTDGDGRFTGTEATKFFAMSNLSRQELKQVLYYLFYALEQGVR